MAVLVFLALVIFITPVFLAILYFDRMQCRTIDPVFRSSHYANDNGSRQILPTYHVTPQRGEVVLMSSLVPQYFGLRAPYSGLSTTYFSNDTIQTFRTSQDSNLSLDSDPPRLSQRKPRSVSAPYSVSAVMGVKDTLPLCLAIFYFDRLQRRISLSVCHDGSRQTSPTYSLKSQQGMNSFPPYHFRSAFQAQHIPLKIPTLA
ncbi:hypothetical protein M422DRAFT_250677 [Sphaerobolus stellatus SS14]|uniref:Uncharacterized protein n=1 Tax=Sphaerobolus stellatus (strain SS14) TaxID=990650 RepID=A0A0C9W3W4_SPHS4|nr:hypothetical protein M422DRAFT_250677 [Sphaerobolus stellatus SS14]